jgi:hypothetical protein
VTHRFIAGKSGWGKSWVAHATAEANLPEYPVAAIFDFKDEYRGLVKHGLVKRHIVGPDEAEWSVNHWMQFIQQNPKTVYTRFRLDEDEWREVVGRITEAVRAVGQQAGGALLVLDEAHFLAPQSGGYPSSIKGVATTGRGEGASSLWITQRPAELDETPIAQADEWLLGGFTSDADLSKVGKVTEYPEEVHNPRSTTLPPIPEALRVDGKSIPLRQFEVGAEWVFSDDYGALERRDARNMSMESTHYAPGGNDIVDP